MVDRGVSGRLSGREILTHVVVPSLLATVLVVLLLALLLKPVIESSAEDAAAEAVEEPLDRAETQIAGLAKKVGAKTPAALTDGDEGPSEVPTDGRLEVGGTDAFSLPAGQTLLVTDLILENPDGDSGTLRVARGDAALLEVRLDNFRDLDYHFVSPIVFGPGEELRLEASCTGGGSCTPALLYVGSIEKE
jgi:hypothetical protein